jgi:glucose/arabinose dehydrogenase
MFAHPSGGLLAAAAALLACLPSCDEHRPAPLGGTTRAAPAVEADAGASTPLDPSAVERGGPVKQLAFAPITNVKLSYPVEIAARVGRTYVAEQTGQLRILGPDPSAAPVVLDITTRITTGYDQGIVGFAFHPAFPAKPYVYVSFTAPHPQTPPPTTVVFESVIARYESADGGLTFDPATEQRLLVWDQPAVNHNNGGVVFGPDGYLYIGSGDGADPKDVQTQNAQKTELLLGKILRVDVDGAVPYAIPPTNPFANGGGRPEIYAFGLRNPWRFDFDAKTGRLWAGDVGELLWEEIDEIIPGGNYGWGNREGPMCHTGGVTCDGPFVEPLAVHSHTEATAIVGGVFYHGTGVPELTGKYIYGDASSGRFWALATDGSTPTPALIHDSKTIRPVSLRLDEAGEILVADYRNGTVVRLGVSAK